MANTSKPDRKRFTKRDIDALLAVGAGGAVTLALHLVNGPAVWWVYLVVFLGVSAATHQTIIRMRAEDSEAYGEKR